MQHTKQTSCLAFSFSSVDAEDFDPDAGFQNKEGGDEWAGEDEGLDTEVGHVGWVGGWSCISWIVGLHKAI